MSTIASTTPSAPASHKQHLLNAVSSKAKTGEITATDETALDSVIDTIDSSLSSSTGSSTSARLDPSQMKSRIDGLISDAVSNGTLTDKQATTLKDIFSQGGKDGEAKIGGVGGPPPGPPPAGGPRSSNADDSASGDASTRTAGTDTSSTDASSSTDLLATFIKQLQASQSQGSAYTAGGSSSSSRTASALLLNFEA